MFLTISFKFSADKNASGGERYSPFWTVPGISHRKHTILYRTAVSFSQAYQRLVQWSFENWDQFPFTFPLKDPDGQPILDEEGRQRYQLTGAHYLANWLASRVDLSDLALPAKLANGARNQAAETLLSQFRLRQTAEKTPRRLTSSEIGNVEMRAVTDEEWHSKVNSALDLLRDPELSQAEIDRAGRVLQERVRLLPILFSGPNDYLLFRHAKSERVFVCLPLLARGDDQADRFVKNDQIENQLVPLRGDETSLPRSKQWLLLPLHRNPPRESMLADPLNLPRTAELIWREDEQIWRFNIVVQVPEAEKLSPKTFLGIHLGYYQIFWSVVDETGSVIKEGQIDQRSARNIISRADREKSKLLKQGKLGRGHYRGGLKLERDKIVNGLIAIAIRHQAVVGIEDVIGINKSTWSRKANLFRSHWDFGRFKEVLTYKAALAGLATLGRGRSRKLFTVSSYRATHTCSQCGKGNEHGQSPSVVILDNEGAREIGCLVCKYRGSFDSNSAKVIALKTRDFFLRKKSSSEPARQPTA